MSGEEKKKIQIQQSLQWSFISHFRSHFPCWTVQNVLWILKCAFVFKMFFHFWNVLSFPKCAFISEMCFHFQKFSLQFSPQFSPQFPAQFSHQFSLQFHFNLYLSFQSNINDDCSCKQVVNRQHTTKTPKPHLFCSLKVDHVRSYTISLKTFRC